MDGEQISLFSSALPRFELKGRKIKTIELFAGYGSQSLALDYLGIPHENHMICEWALPSVIAYAELHCQDTSWKGKYSEGKTDDEIADYLYEMGVSLDYNKPAERKSLKANKDKRLAYDAIHATNNRVDVSRTHLDIPQDDSVYLLAYSFPCQDLSLAGKTQGMKKGEETRSGLLWQAIASSRPCLWLSSENYSRPTGKPRSMNY